MINLDFNIHNPWSDTWIILWNKSGLISKYKAWEFNGYRTTHLINLEFRLRPRGDHAGARIMLGLFGFDVELHFYDTRHWDYDNNTWNNT
jgi:hypothetical protein